MHFPEPPLLPRSERSLVLSALVSWPVSRDGYYDVIITANTSDGFTRRYAGRTA